MDNKSIGKRIKQLRKEKKMIQKQLAVNINKSVETVKKYENGSIEIPLNVLHEIAQILDTSIAKLIGIDPEKTIYSQELGIIARKMHTHYDYVAGKTKDKILTRYDFNDTLSILNFDLFEKKTNHYSIETQAAIFGMLQTYISTALVDWYYTDSGMSEYELDNMFIITSIVDKITSYKDNLIDHLAEPDPNNPPNYILREPTPNDLIVFSNLKTDLLNFISKALDELMAVSLSNEDTLQFEEELKLYFGDNSFKLSKEEVNQSLQDTSTD